LYQKWPNQIEKEKMSCILIWTEICHLISKECKAREILNIHTC
jgi:hypothetical protein